MKASAAKEKGAQRSASRLAHRASGPILSYPKTRIRGSRLLEAAFILAIIELTRRLHQAYQHAYDKQAVDWVLPQNTGMKYLPPGGSYGPGAEKKIKDALENILYNGKCADAFQKAGLDTPAGLLSKGIVIGPATLLLDPNNNSGNGITEAARARDVGVVGSTAIQAITISDHPGYKPDTTDGRARIFLNSSAFGGGAFTLQQVLAHELIHAAGIGPKDPGFFGSLVGRDDLSHFKGYNEIFAACGGP